MADGNKPTHRVICKQTDSRQDRYHNIGVAWAKRGDDGRTIISIRLLPLLDGARVVQAESLLLVPNDSDASPRRGGQGGKAEPSPADPGPADDPGPDDEIPF
jgi:hypothetical protein